MTQVTDGAAKRLAMAHDASHYRVVPARVATPRSVGEVVGLLEEARATGVPVTFRSGGTSLSGQGVGSGTLADVRRHFRRVQVLDDGARVRVEPGATVRTVNARLARYGRKLGPDPASELACTLGGVLADNSSGMACGTERNAYRTLQSMVLVLPGGTVIDTAAPGAAVQFRAREPGIAAGLERLRDRVRSNAESAALVRRMFAMKNTMGYGVNAFLDFEDPLEILAHLLIGSEGTLGFIAQATLRTVPVPGAAATGLAVFASLREAAAALPALVEAGFATIELMDAPSLRVAQSLPDCTAELAALQVREHTALLIELQAGTDEELTAETAARAELLAGLSVVHPIALTTQARERAALWHIRKGLYAAVAGARPAGANALLEDIAVPVPALEATCEGLSELLRRHGYQGSVVFGHAKDGNLHFMLNEHFDDPVSLARYRAFTDDLVALILGMGGTLKAEHGTGRIMAPFVRAQYGNELYQVMVQLKRLVDPHGILAPGVVLSDDPGSYLRDLKTAPAVEAEVDRCVECGYCEPVCPSKDVTLTPRQRIVLRREAEAARAAGDTELADELAADYLYQGVQTCAVDGMCQVACPLDINTGDLVRRLRAKDAGRAEAVGWKAAAGRWDALSRAGGAALTLAHAVPAALPAAATKAARAVLGADRVPVYSGELPAGGARRLARPCREPDAVYFPSCTGTMFGAPEGSVQDAILALCERAGLAVRVPEGIGGFCCGTPWKSKGYLDGYRRMSETVLSALEGASDCGALPIVCDASSCTEGLVAMAQRGRSEALRFVDSVAFARERILPRLVVTAPVSSIVLHPTCSSVQLGLDEDLLAIARAISPEVATPIDWNCCGFAGDRGMLHPELTAGATAAEAAEVNQRPYAAYASLNRTCELGMTRATGHPYQHILTLLERATR